MGSKFNERSQSLLTFLHFTCCHAYLIVFILRKICMVVAFSTIFAGLSCSAPKLTSVCITQLASRNAGALKAIASDGGRISSRSFAR